MMWTFLNAIDATYQHLIVSPLKSAISGDMYKLSLPFDAVKKRRENVVINCLGLPTDQLQHGIVNVNIHVPNLQLTIDGRQDNTQADFERCTQLALIAAEQLKEFYTNDFSAYLQQIIELQGDDSETILNCRIDFFSLNASNY